MRIGGIVVHFRGMEIESLTREELLEALGQALEELIKRDEPHGNFQCDYLESTRLDIRYKVVFKPSLRTQE